ncbi:hypothetical protein SAMN05216490_4898 [Mucilaginibacter mallensis]|uniref:Uncharacterized protein n=1 Tax=Mucilaginibacter mallensis TaxID=652787 RepID=A0A1H2CCS4_MUCMA|nr:hypothetical protein [Mucilaginibacter mallensis]SDT68355.1 hypothetical protein SAMN05216490_4898 [Mucilaginibacter mallensis]
MTQSLDLNKMGQEPITQMEMQEVEGGKFINLLALILSVGTAIVAYIKAQN